MKLTLIGEELGSPTSGQSRFLSNLAGGLRSQDIEVGVAASMIRPEAEPAFKSLGIRVTTLQTYRERSYSKARLLSTRSRVGRDVASRAMTELPADWYVVLADAAIDASAVLPADKSVYVSQGDLGLMLLNDAFFRTQTFAKSLVARGLSRLVRSHAAFAARFRVRLANSEFCRGLMSHLYSTPFTGVVYPPVDTAFFAPLPPGPEEEKFILAISRNDNEEGGDLLERVAAELPVHVVGGRFVPGARNLGVVSEDVLRSEYARASFLLFPVVSELFGYSVAESLACGTPVLAYRSGGPAELIKSGTNGWLVSTAAEALERARTVFREGVPPEMRSEARRSVSGLTPRASASALLNALPK
jgi:glycosyltransferase involved in cell wall biosynthesis